MVALVAETLVRMDKQVKADLADTAVLVVQMVTVEDQEQLTLVGAPVELDTSAME
jgi:hypothetical protein